MNSKAPQPWLVDGQKLFVYVYHHIDFYKGDSPSEVSDYENDANCEALVPAIKNLFEAAGWEGDGNVRIFQIPPVVVPNNGSDGFLIWHVKQGNNGTSWLASEVPLPEGIDGLQAVPNQTRWP